MIKAKQLVLLMGDIILLYGALFLTIEIRYGHINDGLLRAHLVPFSIIFAVWLALFYSAGWYDIRALRQKMVLFETIAVTLLVGFGVAIIIFYSIPYFHIAPKTNLAIFTVIFAALAFIWRLLLGAFAQTPREKVLLLGTSAEADELTRFLEENPAVGYKVQAQIKNAAEVEAGKLGEIIARENISTVVVLGALEGQGGISAALYKNLGRGMEIVPFAEFYELVLGRVPLGELREEWFFENITRRHRGYNFLKRGTDILAAVLVGLVFCVIWLPLYLAVKLTSRGAFIFKQTRVGKNGKTFALYKVRTMYRTDGKEWAAENDKRVTPVGKFLRAAHLDELPQAWNVLKGDISFVGPRPDFIDFFKKLEEQIPYYAVRTLVKPGVTGWAQVNYPVTESLQETRIRLSYDLYYLKHYSFMTDTLIVLKTLKAVFTASGR
jgi:exopolysaccharide biosynthesis polyprenyl glycosylphosphotransferase